MPSLHTELSDRARALAPGFEVQREIGRGGMGVVYLAVDVALDRQVAIKVLPEGLAQSPDIRDRFLREARTAAKLSHPNIVPVYRADEIERVVFFVMGYVDGPSLGERLTVLGALAPIEGARLLRDVALALDYAHGRGVIHRDIKPENILVERSTERPMVTDFGIARMAEAAPLTQTGQVLGTVHYMSPEQVSGDPIDGRSDLYSLGVVGFRLLTGRLPFDNATASAVLVSHVTKAPPRTRDAAPSVPAAIAAVVDRCLRKDPAERFASGAAMATALDEAIKVAASDPANSVVTGGAVPPVLSAREAEAVWARAAELQTETGVHREIRRPLAAPGPDSADPRDRRTLTTGYSYSDVRAAAEEAGISHQYVTRAVEDLGIVPLATPGAVSAAILDRSTAPNPWVGSATGISLEVQVPRELSPDDDDLVLEMIQRHMRDAGHVSTLRRSLRWSSSASKRQLQISIIARGGQTTIRADERLGPVLGGIFGGIMGGVGGGTSSLSFSIGIGIFHSFGAGFGFVGVGIGSAYLLARTIFRRVRTKREAELRALVEELAAQIAGVSGGGGGSA